MVKLMPARCIVRHAEPDARHAARMADGQVAQLVEHGTENAGVASSILALSTCPRSVDGFLGSAPRPDSVAISAHHVALLDFLDERRHGGSSFHGVRHRLWGAPARYGAPLTMVELHAAGRKDAAAIHARPGAERGHQGSPLSTVFGVSNLGPGDVGGRVRRVVLPGISTHTLAADSLPPASRLVLPVELIQRLRITAPRAGLRIGQRIRHASL